MAMDGGSLALRAIDESGSEVWLSLDWSIDSYRRGTTQFYVNKKIIPRDSAEEDAWLTRVREATIRSPPPRRGRAEHPISENRIVVGDDIAEYFHAIDDGPEAAIAHTAARFVSLICSEAYRRGRAPTDRPPPPDPIRSLVMEGKIVEAIKAYRAAHPEIGLAAAKVAINVMAGELKRVGDGEGESEKG
ncbi:Hypothetical protein A7982_05976 [Minicystis rosea]|nr:Hypothetical protein A7982_05976 [Minicystis rosea]